MVRVMQPSDVHPQREATHMRVRATIIGLSLVFCTTAADAAPLLLQSFEASMGTGGWVAPGGPIITGQYFFLSHEIDAGFPFPLPGQPCVGCRTATPVGWTGTIRLDEDTEGDHWAAFLSRLLDGDNDETLWVGIRTRDAGRVLGGVAGGSPERRFFPYSATSTWELDYAMLTVIRNDVHYNDFERGYSISTQVRWEFWGQGTPVPPKTPRVVPEPTTGILFLSAAAAAMIRARKRR